MLGLMEQDYGIARFPVVMNLARALLRFGYFEISQDAPLSGGTRRHESECRNESSGLTRWKLIRL